MVFDTAVKITIIARKNDSDKIQVISQEYSFPLKDSLALAYKVLLFGCSLAGLLILMSHKNFFPLENEM